MIDEFSRLMKFLLVGSRGGANRARILETLHEQPRNAFQLRDILGLDYKTVRHHLRILEEHSMVLRPKTGYGDPYLTSRFLEANYARFEEIARGILDRKAGK